MVIASFPLLILISTFSFIESSTRISYTQILLIINPQSSNLQTILSIAALSTFLVKFPMFAFHLWLPKAHVEAPLRGSIILAGILLKIAGYGIIVIKTFTNFSTIIFLIAAFSLWGGAVTTIFCLYQTDIKILIAYFSIGHISICIRRLLLFTQEGLEGIIVILLAHGLCSAGLFICAYIYYINTNSRNILLSKGNINLSAPFSKIFFLTLIANMGTPPTANFFGEVKLFIRLTNINKLFLYPLFLIIFFSVLCSILFFSFTQFKKPFLILAPNQQQIISLYSLFIFSILTFLLSTISNKLLYLILMTSC